MKKWAAVAGVVLALGAGRMMAQETHPLHPDLLDVVPPWSK